MKKLKIILVAGISLLSLNSCEFFEQRPEDFIKKEDNYDEKTTIYANFIGLLGNLQDVTDQLVFVTELRGDMMMPTDQATAKYWDVYNYNMSEAEANDLYNPAPFYKLVMNSNDFLRNTVEYNSKYPGVIPTNVYRQMIAGAVCLRTWAYLTLGKLYGGAVYYDYAMTNEIDIAKMVDENWMDLEELVPQLIYFMTTGVDHINGLMLVKIDEMFGVSGLQWRRMSIAPDPLLTELYLWNKNYDMAAKRGIYLVTDKGVVSAGDANRWSLSKYFQKNDWAKMYLSTFSDEHSNEAMTTVFWTRAQGQDNSLMKNFYPSAMNPGYKYLLAPTQTYVSMFNYSHESMSVSGGDTYVENYPFLQSSSYYYDPRLVYTVDTYNGVDRVILKFYQPGLADKYFHIYRAGELFLHIAEALVGEGKFEAADSLINYGTRTSQANGQQYPFNSPAWWHAKFTQCNGLRGRVAYENGENRRVPRITSTDSKFMSERLRKLNNKDVVTGEYIYKEIAMAGPSDPRWAEYEEYIARRTFIIDSLISVETGRELGFEGKRFFTLVRMAMHLDNPDILALQIAKKHTTLDDQFETAQILRDRENWFIKYDLKLMNMNNAE